MSHREQLIAYLATLLALVLVVLGAMGISAHYPQLIGKVEAFGLGTITGGLIGVLRIPSSRTPVAATESGDVNVEAQS